MMVLLTNDDGIHAQGLMALYNRFAAAHQVFVVAPDRERSAIGHAITLNQPLRASRFSLNGGYCGYAVNGTPADCIKLAIAAILPDRPDVVVAGINPGANVGANLSYSGTVAAAREAALSGTIGIAASVEGLSTEYCEDAARFIAGLCEAVVKKGLPFGTFLNVNIPNRPAGEIAGFKVARLGRRHAAEQVIEQTNPRGETMYWIGSAGAAKDDADGTDFHATAQGYATITPLQVDLTDVRDERQSRAIGPEQLLELDDALGKLEDADQQVAELVRLRLYAGLSVTEAAKVLGISRTVAYERWDYAMSWFAIELGDPRPM